ncbi:matrilin-3-like [Lethenteron reissneri]|uniref:matrilin-3-like n=1 Tax=Lethenteron reissneri TaxID=7753 RepID=UPI002AB7A46E|nr:matrilin-3-like [Lethenteron reissneri]
MFSPLAGMRSFVPRILVLVMGTPSQDDPSGPVRNAASAGVTLYPVGVGRVDASQLRAYVSDSRAGFTARSYDELTVVEAALVEAICASGRGNGGTGGGTVVYPDPPSGCPAQCPRGEKGEMVNSRRRLLLLP